MKFTEIVDEIKNKRSYLCIGLDSDLDKIPEHLKDLEDPLFEFNNVRIIKNRDRLLIKLQK